MLKTREDCIKARDEAIGKLHKNRGIMGLSAEAFTQAIQDTRGYYDCIMRGIK